jgi:hypothetical protein
LQVKFEQAFMVSEAFVIYQPTIARNQLAIQCTTYILQPIAQAACYAIGSQMHLVESNLNFGFPYPPPY